MQDFIDLMSHMADESEKIAQKYFRQALNVENKSDESPVTIADKEIEHALRAITQEHRPEDGIIGEEYGSLEGKSPYQWIFDPIDGTKSFVTGRPSFGTLIALCENGTPIAGLINQPITQERWLGCKGTQTTFNGTPIKTRPCNTLKETSCFSTSPSMIPDLWQSLYDACNIVVWGGDCYSYGLLAHGFADMVVEKDLSAYDFAALPPIIEGAGGLMCDWEGKPLTLSSNGAVLALGDASLKDEVIELVSA